MLQFFKKIKKQTENLQMKEFFSVKNVREVKLTVIRFLSTTKLYFQSVVKKKLSDN